MDESLERTIYERLSTGADTIGDEAALLVMAACNGPSVLEEALQGKASTRAAGVGPPSPPPEPVGAYLGPLSVQGFRGIGDQATLPLVPGPGLTLVVGRNGSGKSSFADALEVMFTGDSQRWLGRSQVWKEGWRNLHRPSTAEISVELAEEGERRTTATRRWGAEASLTEGTAEVQRHGKPKEGLAALGWGRGLVTYRPFLSYNELGSMLDEGPSKLYDALSAVLGLDDLLATEKLLAEARKDRDRTLKEGRTDAQLLLGRLEELDDERASRCAAALRVRQWDLDAIEEVVLRTDSGGGAESDLDLLRQLCTLELPTADSVLAAAEELRAAAADVSRVADTDAGRAREIADILDRALEFHEAHGDGDCPVCGRTGALGLPWRQEALQQRDALREAAKEADAVHARTRRARSTAETLVQPAPPYLRRASGVGIDPTTALAAWDGWSGIRSEQDLARMADRLEEGHDGLAVSAGEVRKLARAELDRREDAWRPVAKDVVQWLPGAHSALRGSAMVPHLKAGEAWLRTTIEQMRNDRFEPIAAEAQRTWEQLRQQSSVELKAVELEGTGTRRRVALKVTVDGVDGVALGVMSQGELHSLALSLFLPRATLPESPFRFVVIDDPVQSMDPARVGGLARVLQETGRDRQVIVFTHDDRLPEAVRRLRIDARIFEVTRRPGSIVEIREALDPVARSLDDAWAVAKDGELPMEVAKRVVPGFCRDAIEAACAETVRRRRLGRGDAHADIEQTLERVTTTKQLAALALFDDANRAGDVFSRLNQWGSWAADCFRAANEGAHGKYAGDLASLVKDSQSLARRIRAV